MSPIAKTIETHLTSRSVVVLLGLQVIATVGVVVAQTNGWEQVSYDLGIVPELAIVLYAILENATGIAFLSVSNLLPFGVVLLLAAYYFIAVLVAVPSRTLYRFSRRRTSQ